MRFVSFGTKEKKSIARQFADMTFSESYHNNAYLLLGESFEIHGGEYLERLAFVLAFVPVFLFYGGVVPLEF